MGNYLDADNLSHGFLMDRNGVFTTFDAPDAGHVPGSGRGTYPFGINASGAITGWYVDDADANHGFVRNKHGAIVEFDVPGAGAGVSRLQHCSKRGGDRIFLRREQRGSRLRARRGWRVELAQILRPVIARPTDTTS